MRKINKSILVMGLVLLLIMGLIPAASAEPQVPPKPDRTEFNYVFDYAKILDPQDVAKMSSLGRELDEKTKAQVVVVTVDSLGDSTIEEYANTLFRSWGLGDKEKNNGVLLLINKENMLAGKSGRLRIEVGYGLEGAIPDGMAGRIRDNYILPRWEQQKYSEGVLQGYLATAAQVAKEYNIALDGNYTPVPQNYGTRPRQSGSAPFAGLIIAIVILSIFGVITRKRRRNGRRDDDDFGGFGGGIGGGGFFGGGGFGGGDSGGGFGGGDFGGGSSGGGGASG
ncbi:MAG: TPM domain-containing protein [Eubacteriales bacterium]